MLLKVANDGMSGIVLVPERFFKSKRITELMIAFVVLM
jgi:hypothetical protein